jgi:hypothetical protein
MGCEGPTAETAVIAVNRPNIPIAKKREDIRVLPKLPRFNRPAWYQQIRVHAD